MRTVHDILSTKPAPSNFISADDLVLDALKRLTTVNLSYLIVMQNNDYKGIFCERDYARNVVLKGRSSDSTTVGEVLTTDLPVVKPTDSVEQCMNLINTHKTRYLLAENNGSFAGIITIHDLLRQVIASKENVFDHTLTQQLIDYDEGGRIY